MHLRGAASSMDDDILLREVEKLMWKVTALHSSITWFEEPFGSPPNQRNQEPLQNPPLKKQSAWTAERMKPSGVFNLVSLAKRRRRKRSD